MLYYGHDFHVALRKSHNDGSVTRCLFQQRAAFFEQIIRLVSSTKVKEKSLDADVHLVRSLLLRLFCTCFMRMQY